MLRGAEIDPATRAPAQRPRVLAEILNIGLTYGTGRREIAVDPQRNLLYIAGAFDAISGSIEHGDAMGFGSTAITVLDGLKIVDAQGQVSPNLDAAVLGILRIKVLRDANGEAIVPIENIGYSSRGLPPSRLASTDIPCRRYSMQSCGSDQPVPGGTVGTARPVSALTGEASQGD